jgi:5,10-methylene-tetrahydrofolate dehydrogenase/methenyl tetrahydrofolate cyclohydrolase
MTGSKIDGTAIAKSIRERLGSQIKQRQQANPRYRPSLKIVQGESCHDGMEKDGAGGALC